MAAVIADFEQSCKDASSNQERVLGRILDDNSSCHYLQRYGSPQTLAAFKAQVPIISYEDVGSEIDKIASGVQGPLLCSYPILHFFASSGTTSANGKIIPLTAENAAASGRATEIANAYRTRCFPSDNGIILGFFYCMDQVETKSGLLVSAASTYALKGERFKATSSKYTTPYEVLVAGSDWRELTYCHWLCALLQRGKVEQIISIFSYTICEAIRMLRAEWREICSDIRAGSLCEGKVTSPNLRQAVLASPVFDGIKGGDPVEAEVISEICSRDSWSGIVLLLFPRTNVMSTVVTGSMKLYVPSLRDYVGDQVPIVGLDYFSSEGAIGINADPRCHPERVVYTMVPTALYYEFLPVDSTSCDNILGLHEVQVGEQYEVVITNFAGLYRYRIGDVVKVDSFFHEVPRLAFSDRRKAVLSVHNEMVSR
ncbi:hypothetical protein SELMODRAFT_437924 [Selaginella moellendorffii]|uniref:Uncharacterized protein JAR1L5-1 n=1 Tax=Selaginella moellendorffii TaxID=88036 RepID=D8QS08_SELML|nr:probable indole-3-acetic acid-amido synthetase GH3.12 isoform X2 [Selaginella moellendorffii]EFJ36856.1 hypothetical protein SELMODRAFT_437924 [Selaginella moellendorffii]|eukprot:XP_002961596.1 probable indole-3-acetic acid-amido synthetase GH3.12 isoform X2 [Selaginella moellendorffii]